MELLIRFTAHCLSENFTSDSTVWKTEAIGSQRTLWYVVHIQESTTSLP